MIGLIAPSVFKNRKTGKIPGRLEIFGGCLLGSIVTAFIVAMIAPPKADETPAAPPVAVAPTPKTETPPATTASAGAPPVKTLGMTPDAFRAAYNVSAKQAGAKFVLSKIPIKKGEVNDAFTLTVGKGVAMVGSINKKDGNLLDVMVILAGENDGMTPIIALLGCAHALNPSIDPAQNNQAISEMMQTAVDGVTKGVSAKRKVGKLQYGMTANTMTGAMFVFSPIPE